MTTVGTPDTGSREAAKRSGVIREAQIMEVLLTYIHKRMRGAEIDRQKHAQPEHPSPIAYVKGISSAGIAELEATITKLNHIKFEVIAQCHANIVPPIESALEKVRFGLGYVSTSQLIKRLDHLAIEIASKKIAGEQPERTRQRLATDMMLAWIKLRESSQVSRWDIARLIKQDILSKVSMQV